VAKDKKMKQKIGLAKYFRNLPEDAMFRLKMHIHYVQKSESEKLQQLNPADDRYKIIEERYKIREKQLDIINSIYLKKFCQSSL
jgi:hypothetical protein